MSDCPICKKEDASIVQIPRFAKKRVDCKSCGIFDISDIAIADFPCSLDENKRFILSGLCREYSDYYEPLLIKTDIVEDLLTNVNLPNTPLEKIDKILQYVHLRSTTAGSLIQISAIEYPIAYCKGPDELSFLLSKIVELGYLETLPLEKYYEKYRLTINGWKKIIKISSASRNLKQAFIAMWFSDETKEIWENGYEKALKEVDYIPIKINLVEHNEKIDDRIIAEIRKSRLLIADFTGNRGGVYFEAGFAMGLNIPVIWTCKKGHTNELHFDTRQYNHIIYETSEELREKLISRIEATLPGM